ncbi:MAG: PepSY domain-containing protein [Bacteroidota bacterium]
MKKLKGLGNERYNVMFHTHTVSGIVISFALFVIFYAGAFSIFRHEIAQWENPDMRQPLNENFDIDQAIKIIDESYGGLNYYENTNIWLPTEESPVLRVYGAIDQTDSTTERMAAYISPATMEVQDIRKPLTTVSDTIYFLHYFRQIPVAGIYIAGLVALFFLFAIVTGLLIHWKNLLTKMYAFTKKGSWKSIWTNAHTVLGVIGLPFQAMYAVTGAFLGLLILILAPASVLLYNGDQEALVSKVNPAAALTVEKDAQPFEHLSLNELYQKVRLEYPEFIVKNVNTRNYGKEDAVAFWNIDDHQGINSTGSLAMRLKDGEVLKEYSLIPNQKTYSMSIIGFIFKLHYSTYGGNVMRVIYFILAMITCFMIISGILIWRTARNNKRYTLKQRNFHHRITKWYLAVCLSLFPAFAILFLANKLVPIEMTDRISVVNPIFFLSWLGLMIIGMFWNKYSLQNRNYLFIGGLLSVLVPIVNGVVTQQWIWDTWNSAHWVAYIDLFWFFAGVSALYVSLFLLKIKDETDIPQPIDYQEGDEGVDDLVSEMEDTEDGKKENVTDVEPALNSQLAIKGVSN